MVVYQKNGNHKRISVGCFIETCYESSGFLHAHKWLSALVAKGFPCVLCVVHFHVWDQILPQTCTDVFEKLTFQVKNKEKV